MAYHKRKRSAEENEFYELLADRIKMYRLARKMTYSELGRKLNTTCFTQVAQYERGGMIPSVYRLKQIADAFDIELIDLIPEL